MLLEENIGKTLFDINHSKIFIDPPPRVMEITTKINKWDLMILKSFHTAKGTIKKTKRLLKYGLIQHPTNEKFLAELLHNSIQQ